MSRPATFPSLEVSEIVETCRGYGCPISEEDVLRPTPGTVQSTLEWWMQRILGLNAEDCRRATNDQLDSMEHSDIYRESMYVGVMQIAMNQLLQRAAIDDFTTKDLTAPTTTRFRSILSGIINFFLFEQEQAQEYLEPMQEEDEALIVEEEKLMLINQTMRDTIDAAREERALNEPRTAEEKASISLLVADIQKLKATGQTLFAKVDAEKSKIKEINEKTAEIVAFNNITEKEITRVQLQVISSPERVRSTLSDMSATLAREQEAVKSLEAKERLMGIKINILAKYEVDLGACIKILSDWEVDKARATKAAEKYQTLYDQSASLKMEISEIREEIIRLERRIKMTDESIKRFEVKSSDKRKIALVNEEELNQKYLRLSDQKKSFDLKALAKNKEAFEVETQIKAIHDDFQLEMERGEISFKKVRDQVQLYSIKINKALDSINSVNAQTIDFSTLR